MSRAHEESQIKSHRLLAVWKQKRERAAEGVPMTVWSPAWLKLSADRKSYDVIPERAEIVRQIFQDVANGLGMYTVASRLNKAGVPSFGGKGGWHQSYVAKILANRSVLGEYQPHKRVDGARVPDGDPIPNYFPTILGEDLFYHAQHSKAGRRGKAAGRKGLGFANLFSGIAHCGYCRSKMVFENKGEGPKGGTYLVCDNAKRHLGCVGLRWRYKDFETSFLAFVQEVDLERIIKADADAEKRKTLSSDISSIQGELAAVTGLMEKTFTLLSSGGAIDFVSGKLTELQQREAALSEKLREKTGELEKLTARAEGLRSDQAEIHRLISQIQGEPSPELYKVRAHVTSRLRGLIDMLLLYPQGDKPRIEHTIALMKPHPKLSDEVEHLTNVVLPLVEDRKYFSVAFLNTPWQVVFPHDGDPLHEFETPQGFNTGPPDRDAPEDVIWLKPSKRAAPSV